MGHLEQVKRNESTEDMNSQCQNYTEENHQHLRVDVWETYSEYINAHQIPDIAIPSSQSSSRNLLTESEREDRKGLSFEFFQPNLCSKETDKEKELSEQSSSTYKSISSLLSGDRKSSFDTSNLLDFVNNSESRMEKITVLDTRLNGFNHEIPEKKWKDVNQNEVQSSAMMVPQQPEYRPDNSERNLYRDEDTSSLDTVDWLDILADLEPKMNKRTGSDACLNGFNHEIPEKKRKDVNQNELQSSAMMLGAQQNEYIPNQPARNLHSDDRSRSFDTSDLLDFVVNSEIRMEKKEGSDARLNGFNHEIPENKSKDVIQSSAIPSGYRSHHPASNQNYKTLENHKITNGYLNANTKVSEVSGTAQRMHNGSANNYGQFKPYPIPYLPPSMVNFQLQKVVGSNDRFLPPTNPTGNLGNNKINSEPNVFSNIPTKAASQPNLLCPVVASKQVTDPLSILSTPPLNSQQNVASTSCTIEHSGPILPDVTVHKGSPNPSYQQSLTSSTPSNRPSNVINNSNPAFNQSGLTLPGAIIHTGPLNLSHQQSTTHPSQANRNEGVLNTNYSLPYQQSIQAPHFFLQPPSLQQQIGIGKLQLDDQQPSAVHFPVACSKSTTTPSSDSQEVCTTRESGRLLKKNRGITKPPKKKVTKKAANKKKATSVELNPATITQVQPLKTAHQSLTSPDQVLMKRRENIRKEIKDFLCEDPNCDDRTCLFAREYQNHALTCENWNAGNSCYLCWYICGTIDHSERCEDFSCGNIFCKSKQSHTIAESFSDPDFLEKYLQKLEVSEEQINEAHVIKYRNNSSS